jgi:hypothetical protein
LTRHTGAYCRRKLAFTSRVRNLPIRFSPDADSRDGMKESEHIQEPQHHADHHDGIQDGFDAARHGDKAVHQPQQDTHDDEGK